ncbi:Cacna1e [Symbiodinium necroappetens]|uniref:Cacna1e protein n=1 Tax=Symbiodinium necroappetens TaxID=1628268 RepID=A0A813C568_9DINO|nr:Cacna1e [Symbiodinium necroappetens]
MSVGEPLQRCLGDLSKHIDALVSQNAAMRKEIQKLSGKLDLQQAEDQRMELLGVVPDARHEKEVSVKPPPVPEVEPPPSQLAKKQTEAYLHQLSWGLDENTSSWRAAGQGAGGMLGAARLGQLKRPPTTSPDHAPLQSFRELFHWVTEMGGVSRGKDEPLITAFCNSSLFKSLCTLAIMANTVYLGVAADNAVRASYDRILGKEVSTVDRTPEICFTVWFSIEILVNCAGFGWSFLTGPSRLFNIFDVVLVVNSIVELTLADNAPNGLNLSFLRIFRVFRLIRVVRLVRTLRSLRSLRTMLFSIISSIGALFWAFVMLLLTMFMFSIIFGNGISLYFDELNTNDLDKVENARTVYEYFGGTYETLVSLFCSVSGGNDWMTYGETLRLGPGEVYFVLFVFYIFFTLVGLLNVVTGIFVDSAVCTRTEDEVVESFTEEQKRLCGEMRRIFASADMDGNGCITFEEFCKHVEDPWVQAFLSGLDIDISDARIVFTLLDVDGSGSLTVEEFVDGAMKLKGPAKGIDMLAVMFDLVRYSLRFSDLCSFLEEQTGQIKDLLAKGSSHGPARYRTAEEELANLSRVTNRKMQEVTMPSLRSIESTPAEAVGDVVSMLPSAVK